jgi:hypothetical protein
MLDFNDMIMGVTSSIFLVCDIYKNININRVTAWNRLPVLYELDRIEWNWR